MLALVCLWALLRPRHEGDVNENLAETGTRRICLDEPEVTEERQLPPSLAEARLDNVGILHEVGGEIGEHESQIHGLDSAIRKYWEVASHHNGIRHEYPTNTYLLRNACIS